LRQRRSPSILAPFRISSASCLLGIAVLYCVVVGFASPGKGTRHVEWRIAKDTIIVDSPARLSANQVVDSSEGPSSGIAFGEHVDALAKAGHLAILPAGTKVRARSRADSRIEILDGPRAGQVWWRDGGFKVVTGGSPKSGDALGKRGSVATGRHQK
jgi:hypothetical protein